MKRGEKNQRPCCHWPAAIDRRVAAIVRYGVPRGRWQWMAAPWIRG